VIVERDTEGNVQTRNTSRGKRTENYKEKEAER